MTASRPYILWDWNGTLLDDTAAAVGALNDLLRARALPPISLAFYREHFAFPVKTFYAACGVRLADEDWALLTEEYHAAYLRRARALNAGAPAALARVKAAGAGQSILSALRQDLLEKEVARCGVTAWMDFLFGVDNLDGATKTARAHELAAQVRARGGGAGGFVVIGDSLHDKEVADALGCRCVLFAQGSHSARRLRVAAPTAETLEEAVALAGC
jgi:phosphoglycolate phosphatase